jgi:hypothetical protein
MSLAILAEPSGQICYTCPMAKKDNINKSELDEKLDKLDRNNNGVRSFILLSFKRYAILHPWRGL